MTFRLTNKSQIYFNAVKICLFGEGGKEKKTHTKKHWCYFFALLRGRKNVKKKGQKCPPQKPFLLSLRGKDETEVCVGIEIN